MVSNKNRSAAQAYRETPQRSQGLVVQRTYDIFEVLPDGEFVWRDFVEGLDATLARARELAAQSTNEFRVMHLPTHSVVAVLNAQKSPAQSGEVPPAPADGGKGDADLALRCLIVGAGAGIVRQQIRMRALRLTTNTPHIFR